MRTGVKLLRNISLIVLFPLIVPAALLYWLFWELPNDIFDKGQM